MCIRDRDNPWTFEIVDCPDNGSLLIGEPIDEFGVDGCDDEYEDGNGGCLDNPNFGVDGCDDEYEDGEGGCLDELSPVYISSDPNGDNVDYNGDNHDLFNNPEGKENNCIWDEGEDFADEDFSQNWDSFGTYFIYYPNPGFRCVDQIKIKAIDSGANYVESNSGGVMEPSNEESNIIIAEIFVDLCNIPPEIDSYNEDSITQIVLYEDSSLDISSVDLSYFVFSDEDGDNLDLELRVYRGSSLVAWDDSFSAGSGSYTYTWSANDKGDYTAAVSYKHLTLPTSELV